MRKNKIMYIFLLTFAFIFLVALKSPRIYAQTEKQAELAANIPGAYDIRLFGFSAPNAIIRAQSTRVFARTFSDNDGYFNFENLLLSDQAREICIDTLDSEKRISFPLCLTAPLPDSQKEIGPVLLPPTLSLSNKEIWQDKSSFALGKTIPESDVFVSFFTDTKKTLSLRVIFTAEKFLRPSAQASDLPILKTRSDANGNFSFSLPTANAIGYRLFAKTFFENSFTPKSQTLTYSLRTYLEYFLLFILPRLIIFAICFAALTYLAIMEYKTKKGRAFLTLFIEKKLKPSEVRLYLKLQRLQYNFRDWLKKHHM
jgi:hypothetical protein